MSSIEVFPQSEARHLPPPPYPHEATERVAGALLPAQVYQMIAPAVKARSNKKLLLYIHIPFCSSKCHFCDWVVGYSKADLVNTGQLRTDYVDALCRQIETYGPMLTELGYQVTNIYWGGGTPTRLAPAQMAQVHTALAQHIDLSHVGEHTAECSPETVTREHLDVLVGRGLNRISTGAQSFDPDILRRMGRAHSSKQIASAIETFQSAGLQNINLDLITGFPGQTAESARTSIERTIDAGVPHVSLYMFREFAGNLITVKQVSSGHLAQRSREQRAESYWEAKAIFEKAGYQEYIVGYFAKAPEFRFDAEDYYFSIRGDYFGFGAGAASVVGRCVFKSGEAGRYGNSNVRSYIDDPQPLVGGLIAGMPDELFTDAYFKAFATTEGIHYQRWADNFGFDFRKLRARRPGIEQWFTDQQERGAQFVDDGEKVALTPDTWVNTMIWRR